jgi:hypothetical protein
MRRLLVTRILGGMGEEVSAREAARRMGKPQVERTLTRRAREAEQRGDKGVRRLGKYWVATMAWWRAVAMLRRPGPKPHRSDQSHSSQP